MVEDTSYEKRTLIAPPDFHIDLAPLDALHPVHYSRRLLIFRCESIEQRYAQIKALEAGLRELVQRCPLLGGTVVPQPPIEEGQPTSCTIERGDGLELIVRDMHSALPSFEELEAGDFQPEDLPYDYLVPVPQDLQNDRPYPACKVQYSAVNGGTIVTWAMSHSVADGSGNNELLRVLSEEVKAASQNRERQDSQAMEANLGMDRSILRNIKSDTPFNVNNHPGYVQDVRSAREEGPAWTDSFTATTPELPVLVHIPATGLQKLKSEATQPDAAPISSHDALLALAWRSLLRIRRRRAGSAHGQPWAVKSTLFFPTDARKLLGLPQSYIGNAVYQLAVSVDLSALLSSNGLQHAASAIRRAINAVKPETVTSLMTTYRAHWVKWAFMVGSLDMADVAIGTDWTSGSMYEDDWGAAFGPLTRFRYPGEESVNGVLPKLKHGGAEVIICVMPGNPEESDVIRSDDYFGRYV